jgi:hypothetical protein
MMAMLKEIDLKQAGEKESSRIVAERVVEAAVK